jgi:LacI family transcriptional regulator, fructose operon transcriptional repressor
VTMMRQDVQKIILEAFALADNHDATDHPLVMVPTGFGEMVEEDELTIKIGREC